MNCARIIYIHWRITEISSTLVHTSKYGPVPITDAPRLIHRPITHTTHALRRNKNLCVICAWFMRFRCVTGPLHNDVLEELRFCFEWRINTLFSVFRLNTRSTVRQCIPHQKSWKNQSGLTLISWNCKTGCW